MKNLFAILVSIFSLAGGLFAQADGGPDCPNLWIDAPTVVIRPGDIATYTARIKPAGRNLELRYQWGISAGEITSGQGTPTITARQPVGGVTVTVEIMGLPKKCPNMASEALYQDTNLQPELLDSFPGRITAKEKARFNEIYRRLEADPNARGVIFLAGTVRQVRANKQMIVSFITRLRKDAVRLTFIDVRSENELTEFWLVSSGADEPEPGKKGSQITLRDR